MSREIKFRGRHIESGEWIYGYLIGNDVIVGKIVDWDDEYFCTEYWYKVDPTTVGQYTGLKDRNGKEIYEGDIVQSETIRYSESGHFNGMIKVQGAVFYDNGKFQSQYTDHSIRDLLFGLNYHEVIGNVWENGGLLNDREESTSD